MADLPNPEDLSPEATLARHQALAAAYTGEQPMDWGVWALPIYDAFQNGTLTDAGRRTALWAVDLLRRTLGKDCLERVMAAERKRQQRQQPLEWWDEEGPHLIFGGTLWPGANSAPWVFANLLHFATQIGVTLYENRKVLKSLRNNPEMVNWVHGQLQLEVAGLGRRAGWQVTFENALGDGKFGDVSLQGPSGEMLVEAVTLRMSKREINALRTARGLTGLVMYTIQDLAAARGLHVTGKVDGVLEQAHADGWLHAAAGAIEEMGSDRELCEVSRPTSGTLRLSRTLEIGAGLTVDGPMLQTNPFLRLQVAMNDKAQQWAQAPQPGWIRVEEAAGIWSFFQGVGASLEEKLQVVGQSVQHLLQLYPQFAGVIIAPAPLWTGDVPSAAVRAILPNAEGTAAIVRSALPLHRAREVAIIARQDTPDSHFDALIDWYANQASWLDWALADVGQPPLSELVREQPLDA